MPIAEIAEGKLRCFYSTLEPLPESFTKEDALQFNSVVQAVFRQADVIPFRFPTLLRSQLELRQFLQEKSAEYGAALEKLANLVQMELRIFSAADASTAAHFSGKKYLEVRLATKRKMQSTAACARKAAGDLCLAWQDRETRHGLRCYALVKRAHAVEFKQRMKSLALADEVNVLVSGPWPATEFIE
jgi:hypothetical protein